MNDIHDINGSTNFVVTIGRQFGSGGREFGRLLAQKLGIAFYDKELLVEAARNAGMGAEFFERNDERTPSFLSGLMWFNHAVKPSTLYLGSNSISDDSLYRSLTDIMVELAYRNSCVIVGRTADYVLREFPNVFNIFIHAPEDVCVNRIMKRRDVDNKKKAVDKLRRTNKLRAAFYNFYTDKKWGHAESYDLCIDSSLLTMEQWVNFAADIIATRFGIDRNSIGSDNVN